MECKDFQKKFEDFDYSRLSFKANEEFVKHVADCPDCREELEIYYILKYGLSEDEVILEQIHREEEKNVKEKFKSLFNSLDFEGIVDLKLKVETDKIQKEKRLRKYSRYCLMTVDVIMLMTIAAILVIRYL